MQTLIQDLRYGARMLAKKPGFALVAIITLALGIGANTAIFSIVHAVLIRSLPFERPEQLVRVTADLQKMNVPDVGMSGLELFDYRDRANVFDQISGIYPINANITWVDQPERVEALLVDVNYFSLLGANAQLGRIFQAEDYQSGIAEIAVISDGLWKRRYGADPDAIGKKFRLDNDLYTIVGVMPPDFRHPGRVIQTDVEVWAPAGWIGSPFNNPPRRAYMLQGAIARLKPGITVAAAQSDLDAMAEQLRKEFPDDYPEQAGWTPRVIGLQDDLVGKVRPALLILMAAVGLVLLIACANVANLLLVRASARQREIAIRRALGAGRARLIRQMITESVLLAGLGGALGLLVAVWSVEALVKFSPTNISRLGQISLDTSVLIFTLAVSVATGLIFGLAPAIHASNPNLQETLKDAARGATGGARRNRLRSMLVVSEFALALMLLISAALLIRSFWQLNNVDTGFNSQNVLTARLWLPQPNLPETGPYFKHSSRVLLYRQVIEKIATLPGVKSVGGVSQLPMGGGRATSTIMIEGRAIESNSLNTVEPLLASPGYFETLGIQLIRGRLFTDQDDDKSPRAVVISQKLADKFFSGEDPLGKRIQFGNRQAQNNWQTIIGIVRDVKSEGLDIEGKPQIYRSLLQLSNLSLSLVIRTSSAPGGLSETVRESVRSVDPDLPVYSVQTMKEIMSVSVGQQRFAMALLGVFALIALILSSVGIYGVMSYSVSQRTHEIGIRMAMGARERDVLRLIIKQGLMLTFSGMAIGLAGALVATRFMSFLLFAVSPTDPLTFAGITLLLGTVAMLACYFPARKATRVDPMIALRYE
jgi:putative ABC transport system permease protein